MNESRKYTMGSDLIRLIKLSNGRGNEEREPDALYEWRSLLKQSVT